MTYGVFSDPHFHNWSAFSRTNELGINVRLINILDELERAARTLHEVDPTAQHLYCGGDMFHVRGNIPPSVIIPLQERIKLIAEKYGIYIRCIAGNHDMEFNDSKSVGHAVKALESLPGFEVASMSAYGGDNRVAMLEWKDDLGHLKEQIQELKDFIAEDEDEEGFDEADCDPACYDLIIHAPLNSVIIGIPDHGLDAEEVQGWGFNRVLVGHYHNHKHFEGTEVYSIGALTHQTFSDIGSDAGFLIVDQNGVSFYPSEAPSFIDFDLEWSKEEAIYNCQGNFVRCKLGESKESDIVKIRQYISEECLAAGVVVQATPVREASSREGVTVESGETLLASVKSFVDTQDMNGLDKDKVLKECTVVIEQAQQEVIE